VASRQPGAPVARITVDLGQAETTGWPYTLPVIAQVVREGLDLEPGVTILIGQNGSGKSTLVEALASACTLKPKTSLAQVGGANESSARS
jgi:predicted ATPase